MRRQSLIDNERVTSSLGINVFFGVYNVKSFIENENGERDRICF